MSYIMISAAVSILLTVALIISTVIASKERARLYEILQKNFLLLASKDAGEYMRLTGEEVKRENIPTVTERARAKWHHEQ